MARIPFSDLLKKNKLIHIFLKKCKWILFSAKNISVARRVNAYINENINVHLMFNDKFNKPVVDFLNEYFPGDCNLFLCKRFFSYVFPQGDNVIEIFTLSGIKLNKAKKIICHSLFDEEIINRLFREKRLLKKSYWIIWGGDLTARGHAFSKKEKFVFENFKGYCGEADEVYAKENLNIPANLNFYKYLYPFPLNKKILDAVIIPKKNYIQIQIAQSINNSIIPALDYISKFKNENIRVCCILSYGAEGDLKAKIKEHGQNLFGEKFISVENYMTPEDYAKHIAKNDILILNSPHQNAFGNTLAHLYLGKKVFIRDDIQTPGILKARGITVFSTQQIPSLSYDEFLSNPYAETNKENVLVYLDEDKLKENWQKLFDD